MKEDDELLSLIGSMTDEQLATVIDSLPESQREQLVQIAEVYGVAVKREKAQNHFIDFVRTMWPSFISGKHHEIIGKTFDRVASGELKRVIINLPPRHAILDSTKIPTIDGFKSVADIVVGDYVFGPDGVPIKVLGKSELFLNKEIYRVHTDDGAYIDVDAEHLWTVRPDRKAKKWVTYTTEQLWRRQNGEILRLKKGKYEYDKNRKARSVRLPRLPDSGEARHEEKNLLVDPYVLGVWLGDGSSNNAVISCSDEDQIHIRPEIERRGYETTDQSTRSSYGIKKLRVKLRELGVLHNKHIPDQYMTASPEQRRDLLKGLMDTDGNISKKGQCFFSQSNRDFAVQVQQLIRSLGYKASLIQSEAKIGIKSYGMAYKISFYASDVAFLQRKEERTLKKKPKFGRYIKIEKLGTRGNTQCIKVDRDDGLFMAGDGYIITHNSKSEFASYLLPAWFLGRFPHKKVIQCSNTAELAVGFGRKVRNLVDGEAYSKVFPNVSLRSDSKAAGRWSTNKDGDYFAIGTGGTVTGKGADLLIIDDPHSEQEAKLAETNPEIFDSVYEWYTSGPRQRLQPGGAIIIVMCMTGDTPVLMADGSQKLLMDIQVGDMVATFEKGRLSSSKINNFRSSGVDCIYKIQTQSGKILRANERHPFLVMSEGVLEWTRLKHLREGDLLVSLKGAIDLPMQKQSQENAGLAKPKTLTIEKTQTHRTAPSGVMECGKVFNAVWKVVKKRLQAVGYALRTMARSTLQIKPLKLQESTGLNVAMELPLSSTNQWFRSEATFAMYADSHQQTKTLGHIGMGSCALTIAMKQEWSEDCSAMTATLRSDTERRQKYLNELHRISDFTVDPIVSITPDGEEEVFDVEVDRTENFIANGVVSHNTRWSRRDLCGKILKDSGLRGGDEWEVIEFPALLPSDKPLWPEFWSFKELDTLRKELPNSKWQAQYQQNPVSDSAAIIKREWWRTWESDSPPYCDFTMMAWDTAFEKSNRADYSACTIWGVFYHPDDSGKEQANIILLNAVRDRVEFPDLKRMVLRMTKEWEPDSTIIEKKASGAPLIYELRSMGIPVQEYTPVRGNDKITRLNAVSDLFASGRVWAPSTSWAEEVVDEVASFPSGEHDDYVDTVSLALMRFRKGGYIRSELDDEEDQARSFKRPVYY